MSEVVFRKTSFVYFLFLSLLLSASCAAVKTNQAKPSLYLIGDSTVKNGKGNGDGGLWGWGSFLDEYFDTTQVSVQNYALGGTSSRTFRTQGHWGKVLPKIKPGDYVMMQFGHNDSSPVNDTLRARGTIKSNSDEIQEIDNLITKKHEVVHSYGWYLRQFIQEVKAKGATPIVLSPVPRNSWNEEKPNRNNQDYGKWAAEAAEQEGALFIDLNKIIADRYEREGEEKVRSTYFNTTDRTHTIEAGARVNAASVVEGIRQNKKLELNKYLSRQGKAAAGGASGR
ncbi:lysophospholipase [Pontibacter diazotrophicus]|uniref:Lysophospholipase n=1 Tax=Pontibacter diazotrophicus TaxID=1400979 RepID=A0A3D8L250_9BACT|nr:rhamnogalacturonan acetylesterase [Pontibacter diazotrophicus]RDV11491.1 lysophospholipase [Pontibacter diazotrophicus]